MCKVRVSFFEDKRELLHLGDKSETPYDTRVLDAGNVRALLVKLLGKEVGKSIKFGDKGEKSLEIISCLPSRVSDESIFLKRAFIDVQEGTSYDIDVLEDVLSKHFDVG